MNIKKIVFVVALGLAVSLQAQEAAPAEQAAAPAEETAPAEQATAPAEEAAPAEQAAAPAEEAAPAEQVAAPTTPAKRGSADKVVGYFPYWSQYSQFYPKDIRYNTVTNVHYSSLMPGEDGSLAFVDENDAVNFQALVEKTKENGVKLIVAVGGMEAEGNLKAIASSEDLLSKFVSNVNQWLSEKGGDGVELDWQNLTTDDTEDFAKMIDALVNGLSGKVVTAVVYTSAGMDAYKAEALNKLSYVNVFMNDMMTEESETLIPNQSAVSVAEALKMVEGAGVNRDLLIPVLFMYGKSFSGAKGLGSSHQGTGSGNEGYLSYAELMGKFDTPDYKVTFDEASKSEVAVSETESIVFMGIPSVKAVAEQVKSDGMAGVAVYDLSQDFHEPLVSLLVTIGLELRPDVNYKPAKKKK
ncbi:MAG: glycoside hydrolase family 18 protein [Fibrobacter sp.]|nr:glycoside hydrolase family 18 protein [Fibrobacter sp.]